RHALRNAARLPGLVGPVAEATARQTEGRGAGALEREREPVRRRVIDPEGELVREPLYAQRLGREGAARLLLAAVGQLQHGPADGGAAVGRQRGGAGEPAREVQARRRRGWRRRRGRRWWRERRALRDVDGVDLVVDRAGPVALLQPAVRDVGRPRVLEPVLRSRRGAA